MIPFFPDLLLQNAVFADAVAKLCSGQSLSADGAVGSSCALFAASAAAAIQKPVLVVVPNAEQVEKFAEDVELFVSGIEFSRRGLAPVNVLTFPTQRTGGSVTGSGEDTDVFILADENFGRRISVLKHLRVKGEELRVNLVVSTLDAISQSVPSPQLLDEKTKTLKIGETVNIEELRRFLVENGYHNTPAVDLPGEFAVRGSLLDLFAPDWHLPVRVEFFDDEIESLRRFDIATQRSLETLDEIDLTLVKPADTALDLQGGSSLLDYLLPDCPVILVEPQELKVKNEKLKVSNDEVNSLLLKHPTFSFSALAYGEEKIHIQLPVQSAERFNGSIETVCRELNLLDNGEQIYLFCPTAGEAKRLTELFTEVKPFKENRLHLIEGRLTAGFRIKLKIDNGQFTIHNTERNSRNEVNNVDNYQSFYLLSADEIFSRADIRRPKQRQLGQVIDSFLDLQPGDLVVHVAHGIARFRGIETLTKGQQEEEHLHLEFADSQAMYVPVSKIGLVQKYVAGNKYKPKLAKIGGLLWARQKKGVQEAVFDLAEEMIQMQAQREAIPGTAFPADSDWQKLFDAAFPFKETNDQLLAIDAVKQDMEKTRPMDRLLCGDVGFGKTEVAIRAAFKAVDAGCQVAVLVPTTILAEQHKRTFTERMREFPVTVAALSRFQTTAEQKKIIEDLSAGKVDIVIGTHRIVSADVKFKNLGLVVIDEEQRFGVAHKERLKSLRTSVDVLTMTATPIPRTLHFSLLGIREISNLTTPPEDRLPVETHVVRYNEDLIYDAVMRELKRNGQIYFVHNRVNDIQHFAERIQRIVPACRIGIGHAQMSDDDLERVMKGFIEHQFDMLISTTIIESGLDIPNANTIFIDEAGHYGLADLHQLRGRVGRYIHQAYCYLVLQRNQELTSTAAKRLRALEEYSHLGSGFHLAMRDLEIRGAGNILGTQQSGHIAVVGYEMYCQFLEAAVRMLKQLPPKTVIDVELDLPGTALIPISYIADQRIKVDLYRRLTRVSTLDEWKDISAEIEDRFGTPPPEVYRLIQHGKIRVLAHRYRIRSVNLADGIGNDSGYIVFQYVSPKLMEQLQTKLREESRQPLEIRTTADRKAYIPMPNGLTRNSDSARILSLVIDILDG
ncbi:MAG: transcription-repair coupling factor [Planctomycetaceae bacterium]|jgi:transcription-repair coupling factor (superfamily II helicase)|nr:transcription-repair coupling factor [Planctomycetaceae bacterium]